MKTPQHAVKRAIIGLLFITQSVTADQQDAAPGDTETPAVAKDPTESIYSETPHPRFVSIATGEWPPLISKKAPGGGPILRVVSEAFAQMGVQSSYQFLPWRRAMANLERAQVDVSAAWRLTKKRQSGFYWSLSVYQGANVFFHRKQDPFAWEKLEDLSEYRIGTVRGYAYSSRFLELVETGHLHPIMVSKEDQLVRMLKAGRIDVLPGNVDVVQYLIRKEYPNHVQFFDYDPTPFTEKPLHTLFVRTQRGLQLKNLLNRGLEKLRHSGRLREIYDQFDPLKRPGKPR